MKRFFSVGVCLLLCACVHGGAGGGEEALREQSSRDLLDLFEKSEAARLELDPLAALARGELESADRFGEYLAPRYLEGLEERSRKDLEGLGAIDRSVLSDPEQVAYDVFRYRAELEILRFESGAAKIQRSMPLDHLFGFHVTFPDMSSGESFASFANAADYERNLRRIEGFPRYLERTRTVMAEGMAAGQVLPRFAAEKVLQQVEETLEAGVEESVLLRPLKNFPDEVPSEARARFTREYRREVEDRVLPAFEALRRFLEEKYLPASREGAPGLLSIPGGEGLYSYLIREHTSTDLSAEEIHALGLREVARIRGEMERVMEEVGFAGDLQGFFDHLRTDAKFKFSSEEDLLSSYRKVWEEIGPRLEEMFLELPESSFEIQPVPEALEKTAGGAYYNPGAPDGSRPGIFYLNTYDLPSRTNPTKETLFLHEAMPGHHLQASIAQEQEGLPDFLRFSQSTAFIEGWGLYAESLGRELGLFTDPYQYFGHLDLEMFRALRLVVDTGLHAKGWSRREALGYMLENSSLTEATLASEVDRYLVWPAQALAYKIGQLQLLELRRSAQERLGEDFDLAEFHHQVLSTGALPLPVLRAKLEAWMDR